MQKEVTLVLHAKTLHENFMEVQLTNQQARRLILHLQGLGHPPHRAFKKDGLIELIEQLGFVQLDSIRWVERAQHMILFARNQTYRPQQLKKLHEVERSLFENWTHDAAVIPTRFYPYWRHKFARDKPKLTEKFTNWQGEGYLERCNDLLTKIENGGELRSRDVERQDTGPQEMWQWHDGKAALEYLWRTGELSICGRDGFQKRYDVSRRGISPAEYDLRVSHDEFVDWACRSALTRLGFGSAGDIARFWNLLTIGEVNNWLGDQSRDVVVPVNVKGWDKTSKAFHGRGDLPLVIKQAENLPKRIRVLSPFDPVIRDRKRLSWLFGFDYRIEIYVPEAKRKWGYYVFPLLENDRLIGRIDMRAIRKNDLLEVKKLWLEPGVKLSNARRDRLDAELVRQSRLCGVNEIVWLDDAVPR